MFSPTRRRVLGLAKHCSASDAETLWLSSSLYSLCSSQSNSGSRRSCPPPRRDATYGAKSPRAPASCTVGPERLHESSIAQRYTNCDTILNRVRKSRPLECLGRLRLVAADQLRGDCSIGARPGDQAKTGGSTWQSCDGLWGGEHCPRSRHTATVRTVQLTDGAASAALPRRTRVGMRLR